MEFCSAMNLLGHGSARTEFCSDMILLGQSSARTWFCSAIVTLLGQSVRTRFCSDRILLGRCHSARAECSDEILFGQNSVRPRSLCSGRVFGLDSVRTEFCSAVVTLLGQSVRTRFCSDRILFGHGHSARAECSDEILFGQNSARPLSLCSGRVFGRDSVRTEFCSALVTLLGQSVRTRFCSDRILLGRCHSARAECSDEILFGQNSVQLRSLCSGRVFGQDSVRSLSLCSGRVFGRDSVRTEFCSAVVTLLGQSVRTRFCSDRILFGHYLESMSETSTSVSSSEESSSSSSSERVPTSGSEVGTSTPQLPLASTSHPFQPSTSQPLPPSSSQPSHSLSRKNALGDVKDQADDKANPKPWYTADEKSGKMSTEELQDLIREYPLPEGWYARLPGLQEPANYGTKFETGIYEEQVKSGYRLPLHPFALRFFEHYRMAPGQLVPNGWRKLAGLIYLVQTSGYKPDAIDFMRVFFEICFVKGVANCPGWYYIHSRQRLLKGGPKSNKGWHSRYFFVGRLDRGSFRLIETGIHSLRGGLCIDEPLSEEQLEWAKIIPPKPIPAVFIPVLISTLIAEMASGSGKSPQGGFLGVLQKAKGKRKEKQPSAELPPIPKKIRVTPPERSPRILEQVSIDDDPIFRPRWTLRCDDLGMPDSHVSEQHLLHGILPRDKEVFQTQTHETFACSFAQAVYTMYASGSEMLSRFEMARQVAADEAQQKREAVKEAQEASHRAEELSKQEADHLAQIATLEKRLERVKRKAAEELTKARDQGIRDFLDGNAGDEWLKKWTDDGLEIYELGFAKAKEMFVERFPDISLDDFVLPAVISPSGETAMPSEPGDAAASHPPGEGPSGDAPEP
ncbi:hypothetical protein RJ639_012638 [Escallonia herrerae]|uniref:Transposase (putative) gypsy type domain-containing protein n=1 Tax=Escallonia herrerae TaxID=1293975 RepID=A0AA89AS22_9ASTE|nr:hypothetical protein RJ639_012638 [Escallonia herrerae]